MLSDTWLLHEIRPVDVLGALDALFQLFVGDHGYVEVYLEGLFEIPAAPFAEAFEVVVHFFLEFPNNSVPARFCLLE